MMPPVGRLLAGVCAGLVVWSSTQTAVDAVPQITATLQEETDAQEGTGIPLASGGETDTTPPRQPSPRGVLWRSALLPGWGQWQTGHRVKAVFFAGVAAGWVSVAAIEQGHTRQASTPQQYQARIGTRNTRILWYVITATTAALDAYVDAHLDRFDVGGGFDPARRVGIDLQPDPLPSARVTIHF